ncbi:TerC family protein [Desertifilum sp. FACHB-1129]|uniref:Tellurium resistance protein TerC n=1 Tax=Desertifilum tharense IPPAS B-1220 TaxID=1781255 RepID=A0A1E5QIM9_9CYAN|nr:MULTISPECIES: TerC family protein [unclassified Desertifilum]MDA0210103.1 TerC family protein [Cyanobacteria bacterium FC1]OEJ74437.1 hypothetical protein BH720_14535 [Desertifilum tharense IPPAS B-1220]MBD2312591.1 TerC family protein [Desertifilum sp. FACHB-1129]MBD2320509.1 TerC family protein [Desertifilum sp. FACHB-866]MBD2330637.1 TerC family protein [Desertifilum sp. FACHB-868]
MLDQVFHATPNVGIDTFFLLIILVALEAVLSADNAIALAAIAKSLENPKLQRQALNFGLIAAFVLRALLIVTATWVIRYWQFELLGALYLLWLTAKYFWDKEEEAKEGHHEPRYTSLLQVVPIIAVTDLAFSLDSVTTAIALSKEIWLVLAGGTIGIITLRFMAGLFIRWLDEFVYLEDAGYITVALVGLRLLARVINPDLVPPEWLMLSLIAALFVWGFSKRTVSPLEEELRESQKTAD